MNIIEIAGHLGSDPETRFTSSGQKVSSFRVATNSRRGGQEETIWWKVTVWGDRFDKMMPYIKKGSGVIVIGEMQKPTIYNDREGNPQISVEMTAEIIKFSPFGRSNNEQGGSSQHPQATPAQQAPQQTPQQATGAFAFAQAEPQAAYVPDDDDIPF